LHRFKLLSFKLLSVFQASQEAELHRLIYYGSCDTSIRTEVGLCVMQ